MPWEASLFDSGLLHCSIRNMYVRCGFVKKYCCTAPIAKGNKSFLFPFQIHRKLELSYAGTAF
jgi:hypothetical protein